MTDVMNEWHAFVAEEKKKELAQIIKEENLKPEETRQFIEYSFRDGVLKTTGTDIDKILPPVSRFGGGREQKKRTVIAKLTDFSTVFRVYKPLFTTTTRYFSARFYRR